ncbi:helix-turn-helix domain-containing protein [Mycetocola reblochoni]|uniref:HTH cro/C1-type domain-containing protein n=2 Tax=Mycetocola reblochoni TaxID=331618 RepID=A0A1R4IXD2_9MICO|nr:helix-turn-helix transcriptional regulator [Mycetocola reblochoni]RLP70938.1 XRE family transcriptional regulator [Mycetocola reblochoni]SJN24359.1 hypothetical protein FM119_04180 [Mycetocola reblochoni REB411]
MPSTHSDAAIELGRRLRAARVDRELTLEDVGALADMHWTNIGKIERGQVHPSVETLVRIATALDIDPGELLRGFTAAMYPRKSHGLTAADFIAERQRRAH